MSSAIQMTSPPRGAPLQSLDVRASQSGGLRPSLQSPLARIDPLEYSSFCSLLYLWVLILFLVVGGLLLLIKPTFLLKYDRSVNYLTLFWVTAAVTLVGGIALWAYCKQ